MLRPENKKLTSPVRVIVFLGVTRNGCSNKSQRWQWENWEMHPWLTSVVFLLFVFRFFSATNTHLFLEAPHPNPLQKNSDRLLTVPSTALSILRPDEAYERPTPFLRNNHPKKNVRENELCLIASCFATLKMGRLVRIAASRILVHQPDPLWT